MSTTTIKTVGSASRNYSTWTAWEAATPANLTTSIAGGEIWQGEGYADSEFLETVTVSGTTVDSTGYPVMTAAAGQSICDSSGNALNYNAALGVALRYTGNGGHALNVAIDWVHSTRLQVYLDATGVTESAYLSTFGAADNHRVKDCIFKSRDGGQAVVQTCGGTFINCVAIAATAEADCGGFDQPSGTLLLVNCTAVRPSDLTPVGEGFNTRGTAATLNNCASFGFLNGTVDSTFDTLLGDYNATDHASGANGFVGAHSQHSLTYANQFNNTLLATADFKLKSGSDLIAHGNTDATNAPNDFFGTVRGVATDGDVGPHEYVASGPVTSLPFLDKGIYSRPMAGLF